MSGTVINNRRRAIRAISISAALASGRCSSTSLQATLANWPVANGGRERAAVEGHERAGRVEQVTGNPVLVELQAVRLDALAAQRAHQRPGAAAEVQDRSRQLPRQCQDLVRHLVHRRADGVHILALENRRVRVQGSIRRSGHWWQRNGEGLASADEQGSGRRRRPRVQGPFGDGAGKTRGSLGRVEVRPRHAEHVRRWSGLTVTLQAQGLFECREHSALQPSTVRRPPLPISRASIAPPGTRMSSRRGERRRLKARYPGSAQASVESGV